MNGLIIVSTNGGQLKTTSLEIAEHFGKEHKDVLRAIQNLETSEAFLRRNFAPIFYKDEYGRNQKAVEITRDGFMILAMGFTGKKAMETKEAFIEAFNKMEASLKIKDSGEWLATRNQGKIVRKIHTDIIEIFISYAKKQGSRSAEKYYMNFSKMVNAALLEIDGPKPSNLRDKLNVIQLHQVSVAETIISKSILECIEKQLPYKEVYQIAKAKIELYASTVGKSRLGQTERQVIGQTA